MFFVTTRPSFPTRGLSIAILTIHASVLEYSSIMRPHLIMQTGMSVLAVNREGVQRDVFFGAPNALPS
jgi:hypothetical protein